MVGRGQIWRGAARKDGGRAASIIPNRETGRGTPWARPRGGPGLIQKLTLNAWFATGVNPCRPVRAQALAHLGFGEPRTAAWTTRRRRKEAPRSSGAISWTLVQTPRRQKSRGGGAHTPPQARWWCGANPLPSPAGHRGEGGGPAEAGPRRCRPPGRTRAPGRRWASARRSTPRR